MTTLGLLAASAAFNPASIPQNASATVPEAPVIALRADGKANVTVRDQVEAYFADIPILIKVAECESHFHQFEKDGSVYRGEAVPTDVGVMQVNEGYHGKAAQKLGYDLYTTEGNMAYARNLYEREGLRPWISSSYCWAKNPELARN